MRVLLYLCWLTSLTKKSYIDIRVIPTGKGVYFHPGTWHNGVYVAPEHSPATFLTRQGRVHARVSASWASEVSQLCPQRNATQGKQTILALPFPFIVFFFYFLPDYYSTFLVVSYFSKWGELQYIWLIRVRYRYIEATRERISAHKHKGAWTRPNRRW